MGRKRKPEHLKSTTIFVRFENPLLWKIQELANEKGVKEQDVVIEIMKKEFCKMEGK